LEEKYEIDIYSNDLFLKHGIQTEAPPEYPTRIGSWGRNPSLHSEDTDTEAEVRATVAVKARCLRIGLWESQGTFNYNAEQLVRNRWLTAEHLVHPSSGITDAEGGDDIKYTANEDAEPTTEEKELASQRPLLKAKGRRKKLVLTGKMDDDVLKTQLSVMGPGKKPKTLKAYHAGFEHWREVADAKGWSQWLDDVELEERQKRILWWMAYEKGQHGLKARSIRAKRSAVRWMHVVNLRADPFEGCATVNEWLSIESATSRRWMAR
jgi:hypothetical protein